MENLRDWRFWEKGKDEGKKSESSPGFANFLVICLSLGPYYFGTFWGICYKLGGVLKEILASSNHSISVG